MVLKTTKKGTFEEVFVIAVQPNGTISGNENGVDHCKFYWVGVRQKMLSLNY